jgi:ribosomal protein S18 acetylase RimI-like enzyme
MNRLVTRWLIRYARRGDLDAVLALWERSDASPSVTDSIEPLQGLLAFDPRAILIADARGAIVGSLIATWNGWRGSFYRLAVAPEFRRGGLATMLVREGEGRLREHGAVRLDAVVTADQGAAMSFWRSAGYQYQSDRRRFVRNL